MDYVSHAAGAVVQPGKRDALMLIAKSNFIRKPGRYFLQAAHNRIYHDNISR
jgi:hypothetical protein